MTLMRDYLSMYFSMEEEGGGEEEEGGEILAV